MTAQTGATTEPGAPIEESSQASRDVTRLYQEGLIAGLVGAATVALWFLVIDSIQGRPLYTPTVLGTALFGRGAGLPWPDVGPDFGMVLMFMAWPAILVANLLAAAAMGGYFWLRHPNLSVQP
ncbi:MAG: hypothetical protein DMD95_00925 [Candidatus Rokuibacteriota bacterium]|nr:MAG: hypothetical protein DMD95_00925 [Candidatus Rokubacteria bacterium]